MINEQIPKVIRESGNLHESSYFEVVFADGSMVNEKDTNWSDISEEKIVKIIDSQKIAKVCKFPVKKILVRHNDLFTEIDVPEGCEVYQAFKSESRFMNTGESLGNALLGRVVGLIKDGEVIEENYIDIAGNNVIGFKK